MAGRDDTAHNIIKVALKTYTKLNKVFNAVTAFLQVIVLPQLTPYQWRVYYVYFVHLLSGDLAMVILAKALQVLYNVPNFMLLLSVGSLLPFIRAAYNLWRFIPCPPMAEVVSDIALLFVLIVLLMFGVGSFLSTSGFWGVYAFIFSIWPWLVLSSMISRLYVQRNAGKNPFSAVRELPALGLMSAGAQVLMLISAKELTVCDCIVLMASDPIFAAVVGSIMLGPARRDLHFRSVKMYLLMAVLIILFIFGDAGRGSPSKTTPPSIYHGLFAAARLLVVSRSIFCKWKYATFNHTTVTPMPPESELMFYGGIEKPRKHRFKQFPAPTLLTLDAIFDSGLRDSELHGMGPLGTLDLYTLTECTYLLPVASILVWTQEQKTISIGLFPPALDTTKKYSAATVAQLAATTAAYQAPTIYEPVTNVDMLIVLCCIGGFCISRYLVPYMTARSLFDRGSAMHTWQYQPALVAIPFFTMDVLYLNGNISKFQMCIAVLLGTLVTLYRSGLWNIFRRKYLLLCTQELYYHQPSALRRLQKRTILEFLSKTSTEDFGCLLLETAIRHGGNIRELARDTSVEVWDPSPSSTAAWKLAYSLVTKSLKRQKALRNRKKDDKAGVEQFIKNIVLEMVFKAVETCSGHGGRLRQAGELAKVLAKRKAVQKLHSLAQQRRTLREKRKAGQLSHVPHLIATTGGTIRPVRDMVPMPRPRTGALPLPPPSGVAYGQREADRLLSLNAVEDAPPRARTNTEEAPLLAIPGELLEEDSDGEVRRQAAATPDGKARGIYAVSELLGVPPPSAHLVIAFGDPQRGQLGMEPQAAEKQTARNTIITIEDLRGCEPVQVVAAGVASFVVGARGQVWAFGSNRSMELGTRKEVAQVQAPQRVKCLRNQRAVQVAGSCSASGQAHTLLLTGEGHVYTFGTSNCGAMGQGAEVRQTTPILLRMTSQVPIRQVAAGARHSLMVTDQGQLYTFGDNRHGQLGHGRRDPANAWTPKFTDMPGHVDGELAELRVHLIAVGDDHNLLTTEDGRLFAWGANANGQLGLGRTDDQATPLPVRDLQNASIISMACGSRHSLVVAQGGKQVWAFGSNVQGQLGVGQSSISQGFQLSVPTAVPALTSRLNMEIVQVAAAACHSLGVTRSGEVYAWGANAYGQLGFPRLGASHPLSQAVRHAATQQLQQAAANMRGAGMRTRASAEVGANAEGVDQLFVPARVISLALYRVVAVSTADMHTLALAASATI